MPTRFEAIYHAGQITAAITDIPTRELVVPTLLIRFSRMPATPSPTRLATSAPLMPATIAAITDGGSLRHLFEAVYFELIAPTASATVTGHRYALLRRVLPPFCSLASAAST